MGFGIARAGHDKDTLRCHGHCRDTLLLDVAGKALQEYSAVAQDTLGLGTAGILCGRTLQGCVAIEHCKDTWLLGTLGTAGIL